MLYRCQGNFPPSPPEWWTTRALEAVQIARCLCVAWRLRSWRIRCWGNPQELSNAERSHKYIYIIFRSIKAWKSRGRAREHKRPWTPTVFGCIMLRICWFFGWNGELNYIYILNLQVQTCSNQNCFAFRFGHCREIWQTLGLTTGWQGQVFEAKAQPGTAR